MSNQLFQQNLDDKKGPQPGGPYLIQILFKEPVDMPDKETMTAVIEKHIGSTECFCYDKQMAGFAAQEHIAEFKDGKCPVQLMVMKCDRFKGKGFDAFLMSQMWDCQEDRERIFRECKYQVVATDMLAAALPALERANLDADFLEALAELYFQWKDNGKLDYDHEEAIWDKITGFTASKEAIAFLLRQLTDIKNEVPDEDGIREIVDLWKNEDSGEIAPAWLEHLNQLIDRLDSEQEA